MFISEEERQRAPVATEATPMFQKHRVRSQPDEPHMIILH
jgi:hypothetical protein